MGFILLERSWDATEFLSHLTWFNFNIVSAFIVYFWNHAAQPVVMTSVEAPGVFIFCPSQEAKYYVRHKLYIQLLIISSRLNVLRKKPPVRKTFVRLHPLNIYCIRYPILSSYNEESQGTYANFETICSNFKEALL